MICSENDALALMEVEILFGLFVAQRRKIFNAAQRNCKKIATYSRKQLLKIQKLVQMLRQAQHDIIIGYRKVRRILVVIFA